MRADDLDALERRARREIADYDGMSTTDLMIDGGPRWPARQVLELIQEVKMLRVDLATYRQMLEMAAVDVELTPEEARMSEGEE